MPGCSALDISVLPSYGDEGVPQASCRRWRADSPSVSTPVGAIAEAVEHGETGLLVPPRDSRALGEALAALMRDDRRNACVWGAPRMRTRRAHFGIDRDARPRWKRCFARVRRRAR